MYKLYFQVSRFFKLPLCLPWLTNKIIRAAFNTACGR